VTIDELARRAGETTRNVRAYQARGLLPGPRLVGRVGEYDERHLDRLVTVQGLRDRGFSLAAIAVLLTAHERGVALADVIGPRPANPDVVDVFDTGDGPEALRLALVPEPVRRLAG
jgi:DNA-binding transcriptional MerR regulator